MKNRYSQHILSSEDSSHDKTGDTYQIEPFDIEQNALTHDRLNYMIQNWDSFAKIQEKFFAWQFSFSYQIVTKLAPKQFYHSAIHYAFLKKLPIVIKDFDQNIVLKLSLKLKEIYKIQSLAGKLKNKRFDYLLLVTVKLIGFFIGSHTREVIVNTDLESQIYTILVYVLLGTQVGEKAYGAILERYKHKSFLKFNGRSHGFKPTLILSSPTKQSSQRKDSVLRQTFKQTTRSKKRIGRAQCRTGTALFHQLPINVEQDKYGEMKEMVKSHLMVKEFVPKPKPKESLDEVVAKVKNADLKVQEMREAKKHEKNELKSKKIFYTQMSCSLDLNRNSESLNVVRNHCLNLKPQKRSKHYQLLSKQTLTKSLSQHQQTELKLPRIQKSQHSYSYQAIMQRKISGNHWKKVIEQMKESRFENVERFPPIGAEKLYLKHGEDQEEKRNMRASETVEIGKGGLDEKDKENYVAEYLTQRVIESPRTKSTLQVLPTIIKVAVKKAQQANSNNKKVSIVPVLQQIKSQVNITEYSSASNVKEIYKNQKAYINVYSNQPMDDLTKKLKKKSFAQLKEIEKKFQEECEERKRKIQHSHFS